MIIEQSFTVRAPREAAAAFFCDIDRVAACMPGAEGVTETSAGRYTAVMAVRLGPIRAAFQGEVAVDDSEAPSRLKASGQGRDRATGSVAKVDFTADLVEVEPGTTAAVADVALRGRMAQFGTGVMRAAAGELVQEFAACVNASLAAEAVTTRSGRAGELDPEPVGHRSAAGRGLVALFARAVVAAVGEWFRAVRDRLSGKKSSLVGGSR